MFDHGYFRIPSAFHIIAFHPSIPYLSEHSTSAPRVSVRSLCNKYCAREACPGSSPCSPSHFVPALFRCAAPPHTGGTRLSLSFSQPDHGAVPAGRRGGCCFCCRRAARGAVRGRDCAGARQRVQAAGPVLRVVAAGVRGGHRQDERQHHVPRHWRPRRAGERAAQREHVGRVGVAAVGRAAQAGRRAADAPRGVVAAGARVPGAGGDDAEADAGADCADLLAGHRVLGRRRAAGAERAHGSAAPGHRGGGAGGGVGQHARDDGVADVVRVGRDARVPPGGAAVPGDAGAAVRGDRRVHGCERQRGAGELRAGDAVRDRVRGGAVGAGAEVAVRDCAEQDRPVLGGEHAAGAACGGDGGVRRRI